MSDEETNQTEEDHEEDLELNEDEADAVRGGDRMQDASHNSQKGVDKAAAESDRYLRG